MLRADAPRFPIAAASDAYLAATHLTRADALGRGVFEVLSDANPANAAPSGVANLRASLEAVLRTRAPHAMAVQRYDLRRPDGTWEERYWAPRNIPVPVPDAASNGAASAVRYILHHVEDVTDAVRGGETREALDRAERGAAAVLARIADAYIVLDRDFCFVDVNPAAERSMRRSRAELLGRSHWAVFPASHDIDAGRNYRRAAQDGVELHFMEHYRYEGYDVHLEMDAYPTDEGGVAVFWRDVTARVRAEAGRARLAAEVAAERERLRAVVLHTPAPLALVEGPEHRFTLVNDAYKRVSGGGRDVTGLTPRTAFPELAGSGMHEIFDRVYATGEPWVGPETLVRYDRDGTGVLDTWFDLRFEPVRDAGGQVTGVFNFAVDVTDQVRARREVERLLAASEAANAQLADANARLQEQAAELEAQAEVLQATAAELEERTEAADQARAEAEAANRAKGDFLAVMSHELRTPLNAIGGYAQLMELGLQGPVTPEQLAALGRIQRGQQHLLGLINSVLNYAKLEAGHVQYHPAPVPAAELLAEAAALVAPQARAKGLALQVAPCAPDLVARADGEKVGQVLLNLLSNAVKFTRGGGTVTVAGARAPGGRVALTVADTGRGIAADQLARVFEPFVQVDQRLTRAQDGTGLGLAISRDLARGMGGDLTAESAPGVGSRFTLTLPPA